MEMLKSAVPESLKRMVGESSLHSLLSSSSSLLHFFLHFPRFHQMIRELASPEAALCAKNREAALELKQKGNRCFTSGDFHTSLTFYSQALRVAPSDADDMGRDLVATLYANRASSFHKMGLLAESLRDCNRALEISPGYAKVLYRRGKVNASLGNYEDAVHDLNVALSMELSHSGKRQIENELNMLLEFHGTTSYKLDQHNENVEILDVPHQVNLKCVMTPDKGRGMTSQSDTPKGFLIHVEDPYAMVISKQFRETHCHYCLKLLPKDTVPCTSCSIPLYCSQHCQVQAGGKTVGITLLNICMVIAPMS